MSTSSLRIHTLASQEELLCIVDQVATSLSKYEHRVTELVNEKEEE